MDNAWVTLAAFMHKSVEMKRQEIVQQGDNDDKQRGDIFTRLVAAFDGDRKYGLDAQEVVRHFQ